MHSDHHRAEEAVSLALPGVVKTALRRGVRLVEEGRGGKGLKAATVAAAKKGISSGRWPADKWIKASAWFARHKVDRKPGWNAKGKETPGFTAWCLWGDSGDGKGRAAIDARAKQIKAARKKMREADPRTKNLIESVVSQINLTEATLELPDDMDVSEYLWGVSRVGAEVAKDEAFDVPAGKPSQMPSFSAYPVSLTADKVVFDVWMFVPGERAQNKSIQLSHRMGDEGPEFSDPVEVEVSYKPGSYELKPVGEAVVPTAILARLQEGTATEDDLVRAGVFVQSTDDRVAAAEMGIALSNFRVMTGRQTS